MENLNTRLQCLNFFGGKIPPEALSRDEPCTMEFILFENKAYLASVSRMDGSTERLQAETNQETATMN